MTAEEARKLLRQVDRNFREWRTRKDCRFVFGPLRQALARLDRPGASARDRYLLATAYCFLGDMLDFIRAPRAAAREYRASIRLDPDHPYAWGELGSMLLDLGRPRAALRALDTAIRLGDDDYLVRSYREDAVKAIRDPASLSWRRELHDEEHELLARNRPRAVLTRLAGRRGSHVRRLRARAHGALGDAEGLLLEWEGLRGTRLDFSIENADWFFDPGGMWDMPRFWRALWAIRDRNLPGWGPHHMSLWDFLPEPKKAKWDGKAARRRHLRRHKLMLRYHLARTEKDAAAARRLARRYPQWPEAVALSRKLT